jgi:UDP-2-acetamido-3-amino-2,3-dideoxy-glucuronate N-acetyltransferase
VENRYYLHESSYIDEGAEIGSGTKIWHFCHIMPGARIGENCILGQNIFVASDTMIGNNVKIQNNVSIYTGVILENDVFLGPSMVFTNVINPRSHIERKNEYQTTLVKQGVTIGANATILCGITIGEYAFIGAGAVVTRNTPAYGLLFGNPARIRGWMCQCGLRLNFETHDDVERAICSACGGFYLKIGLVVRPAEKDS